MGDFIDKIKGSNTDTTTSLKGERNETIPLGCTNITPFSGLITFSFGGSSAGFGTGIRHMISWIAGADISDNIWIPVKNTVRPHISTMDGMTTDFRPRTVA
jgi:hypothetical protein